MDNVSAQVNVVAGRKDSAIRRAGRVVRNKIVGTDLNEKFIRDARVFMYSDKNIERASSPALFSDNRRCNSFPLRGSGSFSRSSTIRPRTFTHLLDGAKLHGRREACELSEMS